MSSCIEKILEHELSYLGKNESYQNKPIVTLKKEIIDRLKIAFDKAKADKKTKSYETMLFNNICKKIKKSATTEEVLLSISESMFSLSSQLNIQEE
jgi:hypothetical protein